MAIRKMEQEHILDIEKQQELILEFLHYLSIEKEHKKLNELLPKKDCKLENWKVKI